LSCDYPNQKSHNVGFCVRQFAIEGFGDRVVPESFNHLFWKKLKYFPRSRHNRLRIFSEKSLPVLTCHTLYTHWSLTLQFRTAPQWTQTPGIPVGPVQIPDWKCYRWILGLWPSSENRRWLDWQWKRWKPSLAVWLYGKMTVRIATKLGNRRQRLLTRRKSKWPAHFRSKTKRWTQYRASPAGSEWTPLVLGRRANAREYASPGRAVHSRPACELPWTHCESKKFILISTQSRPLANIPSCWKDRQREVGISFEKHC